MSNVLSPIPHVSRLMSHVLSLTLPLALALAATTAVAAPGDLAFRFGSVGPDAYADGSEVLPGESYALVWTREGASFAGFAADGTAAVPADSAVLMLAPVAAKGPNGMHCPEVLFQLDAALAAPYAAGGTLTVCLVDTRLAGNRTLAGLKADGTPKLINAWGTVTGAKASAVAAGARADVAMGAPDATAIPAGTPQPRITAIRKVGDKAYLTVAGTVPYLQYNATKGDEPQTVQGGTNAAEEPKNGVLGEDVILVVPAQGAKSFYGLKRN